MKVFLNQEKGLCLVEREKGDKKCYGVVNASGESLLLHKVKKILNADGFDFVKRRMWKDGHLVDSGQQYLRERKAVTTENGKKRQLAIYNRSWHIEGAEVCYNRDGKVFLIVENVAIEEV